PASAHHHHKGGAQNDSVSSDAAPAMSHDEMMMGHLYGMWLAFGLTAAFIVYFVYEIRAALSRREGELASARERGARTEKLIALGTLSAGAAHELATPLSTIAVVARELELGLQRRAAGSEVANHDINTLEDVQLIRGQVDRCRDILGHMSAAAGDTPGEVMEAVSLVELVDEATHPFAEDGRLQLQIATGRLVVPRSAFIRAIRSLVANALMASESDSPVSVTAESNGANFELVVVDRGIGMSAEVLERATEPFFTTRSPGQGMGLGLFLARAVVESMGGRLDITSEAGRGTTARLSGPLACNTAGRVAG
ncbi:MAG: two-component system sensor histidine kinase RegB, partial [Myxococcota bacterium]